MKFYYVYVLRSRIRDWIYVGITPDLKNRFKVHNSGGSIATKSYRPFDLIFYEAYQNLNDAKRRERYLKTTKGKITLRLMLKEFLRA